MSTEYKPLFDDTRSRTRLQLSSADAAATPIVVVRSETDLTNAGPSAASWARVNSYKAKHGEVLPVPDASGGLACVLLGLGGEDAAPQQQTSRLWAYAALPGSKLPAGTYALADGADADEALLGWMLGCYRFERYKTKKPGAADAAEPAAEPAGKPLLVVPAGADNEAMAALAHAFYWARDSINCPAQDLGPQHLAAEAAALAAAHTGAKLTVIEGDDLLAANYPAIHTVGRAAARPPLLLELTWQPGSSNGGSSSGSSSDVLPLVALVGKGVCFDSGGLDIKTATGMRLMKKDMGGAALVLALAHVVMSAQLPIRLRVLVPCVENAIAGNAYRPGDVLATRSGMTVENGNTDAEGRLILCDCLWEAANAPGQAPDVLIDAATLTGAARVALGPELPAVFSNNDEAWAQLKAAAKAEGDPMWRLPLWPGYRKMLDSKVADISSTGEPGSAGSITAALFLHEFAKAAPAWLHVDTAGWVSGGSTGPGRPEGGEALGLRALWRFLRTRYSSKSGSSNGAANGSA